MAGLFQGDPIYGTTTTETQATAPEFYTNYLQDIANLGQNAVQQGGVAGFSPLQQQAFQMAPDMAFAGSGSLGTASQLMGRAGGTTVPDVIGDYMNPYTAGVVDEMGRLQQRNIQENVLPNIGGMAAGSGQFGSRRQQQVTGNTLRDMQADLTGKQMGALQSGYTEAGKFAQNDLQRALQAGTGFENLGEQQQKTGLAGLGALSTYGAQEQAQGQRLLDYPMAQAQHFSKLLGGYTMPMGAVKQETAPLGTPSNSPLSQIAGLLTGLGSFYRGAKSKDGGAVTMKHGGRVPMSASHRGKGKRFASGGVAYHDGRGNFYDATGVLVG